MDKLKILTKLFSAKMKYFPYAIIRKKKTEKLIGWYVIDPSGFLNHQFILPEYRNLGLGKIMELHLLQKAIK